MNFNAKIYALILQRIQFIQQGLPPLVSEDEIIYATNLLNAYNFVGISNKDRIVIGNELKRITNNIEVYSPYTQGLFNGFFNVNV